jgi:hypothetical protein
MEIVPPLDYELFSEPIFAFHSNHSKLLAATAIVSPGLL